MTNVFITGCMDNELHGLSAIALVKILSRHTDPADVFMVGDAPGVESFIAGALVVGGRHTAMLITPCNDDDEPDLALRNDLIFAENMADVVYFIHDDPTVSPNGQLLMQAAERRNRHDDVVLITPDLLQIAIRE